MPHEKHRFIHRKKQPWFFTHLGFTLVFAYGEWVNKVGQLPTLLLTNCLYLWVSHSSPSSIYLYIILCLNAIYFANTCMNINEWMEGDGVSAGILAGEANSTAEVDDAGRSKSLRGTLAAVRTAPRCKANRAPAAQRDHREHSTDAARWAQELVCCSQQELELNCECDDRRVSDAADCWMQREQRRPFFHWLSSLFMRLLIQLDFYCSLWLLVFCPSYFIHQLIFIFLKFTFMHTFTAQIKYKWPSFAPVLYLLQLFTSFKVEKQFLSIRDHHSHYSAILPIFVKLHYPHFSLNQSSFLLHFR